MKKNNIILVVLCITAGTGIQAARPYQALPQSPHIAILKNEQALQQFIKEHQKAIVQFFKPSCPICNTFKETNIFEETATHMPVGFATVSLSDAPALHRKYNVQGWPTFYLFENGIAINTFAGYQTPQSAFESHLTKLFANPNLSLQKSLDEHNKKQAEQTGAKKAIQ